MHFDVSTTHSSQTQPKLPCRDIIITVKYNKQEKENEEKKTVSKCSVITYKDNRHIVIAMITRIKLSTV